MFEWTQKMRIDGGPIDEDHKQLLAIANHVLDLNHPSQDVEELKVAIRDLYEYVKDHFKREENLMQELEYPDREVHEEKHQEIIKVMNGALTQSLHMTALLGNFKDIMNAWVVDHIMTEDKKIQAFILGQKGV